MLSVVINWIYIFLCCFLYGFLAATAIEKYQKYKIKRLQAIIVMGLVILTVYAQYCSLVMKVAMASNLIMIAGACLIVITQWERLKQYCVNVWKEMPFWGKITSVFIVLLWSIFTAKGIMHYDTDLYHAQSIRWIEEYGVVPGLANLHNRFGYNSASFALSALFSMKWLCGHSLHTMSGFFACLLSFSVLDLAGCMRSRKLQVSDFARVAAFYYLVVICREIVAPASDYMIMCTVFYIVITWLSLLESEKDAVPYALLCMCGMFAVTLKVTAGFIILLAIKPIVMLLREKKGKQVIFYIIAAVMIALPWVIRNVIISGYLLYPFPEIDLFHFDYKISPGYAKSDANEIKVYGRGIMDATRAGESLEQWVPDWFFHTLSTLQKLFVLSDVICILGSVGYGVSVFLQKKWKKLDQVLVLFVLTGSFCFWFQGAPMVRYGYAYVLLMAAVPVGMLVSRIGLKKIVFYPVVLFMVYKCAVMLLYSGQTLVKMNPIWQQAYGTYALTSYQVGDVMIYYPVEGDRQGYDAFPATNGYVGLELRGESIRDGFRKVNP